MDKKHQPTFVELFLDNLKEDFTVRGLKALVPIWILSFGAIGAGVAWTVPEAFWNSAMDAMAVRIALYAAVLTVNGLLLALSWNSFGKIYETAAAAGFSGYLRDKGMLNSYFFYVDFIHFTQVFALAASGLALIVSLYDIGKFTPLWLHRLALAGVISTGLYALHYALGSVKLMQDLVRARLTYEDHMAHKNVAQLHPRNGR